ncbi:MAG: hypothetical protein ACLSGB_02085 [Dorea sp.]
MMAATLGMAQAEAMKNAASNPNGAMMGFMGMNMASGGMNIQGLYDREAYAPETERTARNSRYKKSRIRQMDEDPAGG